MSQFSPAHLKRKLAPQVLRARQHLKHTGWSYDAAAKALGVSTSHFSIVLTGARESRSLIERVLSLPDNPDRRPVSKY